jgi:hypothetical protein
VTSEVVKESAPRAKAATVSQSASLAITNTSTTTYRYRDAGARRLYQRDLMRSRRRAARRDPVAASTARVLEAGFGTPYTSQRGAK